MHPSDVWLSYWLFTRYTQAPIDIGYKVAGEQTGERAAPLARRRKGG